MPPRLLHSVAEFADLILGSLTVTGARHVVEVGAEAGTMTQRLIDHTREAGGSFVSIDPSPSAAVEQMLGEQDHARLVRATGIEAIPSLDADAWIIDGDHNYWTVTHESRLAWERTQASGGHFLAFYHDVCWPWARRDLYYAPDRVPAEFRQPHAFDRGVTLDVPGTVLGGFRGNGEWACALREGGPRNGVLTAIEDFIAGKEDQLLYAQVPAVFGLGVLFSRHAPWTADLASLLLPFHDNPLLARLERNRIENYLHVISLQDKADEAIR